MKLISKYLLISIALTIALWLAYSWYNREEWQTRKRCADCEVLENEETQRIIGTVEILPNGETVFTESLDGFAYKLIPCDINCKEKEMSNFNKIGVVDYATQQPIYFDIEGKIIPEKDEFIYNSVIVLNTRKFVNPQETKGLSFDKICEKYTPIAQETFLLSEGPISEFRVGLEAYFNPTQMRQPIPIKEVTWEISDTDLLTIWFVEKQNQWQPLEQYEWQKGMEF